MREMTLDAVVSLLMLSLTTFLASCGGGGGGAPARSSRPIRFLPLPHSRIKPIVAMFKVLLSRARRPSAASHTTSQDQAR